MSTDSIVQKIKKLLAKADSTSYKEEAHSAFLMAQHLLIKYNLDISTVQPALPDIKKDIISDIDIDT